MKETHLGPYELLEELGSGGMSTVYRAYQPSMDRQVAVKVIRSSLIHDTNSRERFQREARLIARLEHPHIVPVYDFDGGHEPPYIVMRYIRGSTLKDVIRSETGVRKLPVSDVIYLLQQIGSALDYAHRQGVIHRDVKPSNIILDLDGNAFLSDFGIARFAGEAGLTATGALGTPAYMSPEQATGMGEIGTPADIYSLGVVAFELLVGFLPFEAETSMALAFKHLHEPPPRPSDRNAALPAGVDDILERALAKQPGERYETASEFVLSLASVLQVAASQSPTGLQSAIEMPSSSHSTPSKPGTTAEQNKVVTVLHADAAEYAEIINAVHGPEAARNALRAVWTRIRKIIGIRQGMVIKNGETDLSVLWGAETSREDDPERAVRSALELQTILRTLGSGQFVESEEEPLPLRIGINTGLALISPQPAQGGDTTMIVSGPALTLAQRLAENADGIILISHDTYREVAGVFSMLPAEPVRVRGRKEPIETYRVTAVKARAFRVRQRGVEGLETRMMGREAQLKQVQNAFLDANEDRETQVVTILGEAGIGKSRLAYEFTKWVELRPEKVRLFEGRAMPEMTQHPYSLWRDIFSFRFQILENDPAPLVREKMVRGVADLLGQVDLEMAHLIGHLVGFDFSSSAYIKGMLADPQQLVGRARQLTYRFFARLGEVRTMMLILEDLHYADDASLDLLSELVGTQQNLPLLVICLARPALLERRPAWGNGQSFHKRLYLEPLDRRDSRDLARELLQKIPELPKALRDLLVDRAEGNPLYMEELVKMLIDDRVIVKVSDIEWRVQAERLDEARVPPSLIGLLQARLDSLLQPERLALQRAAVIGRVFYDTALHALDAADEPRDHITDPLKVLKQLIERGFIQRRETSAFSGSVEYMFMQSMLRDQIYVTLLRRQVIAYHTALAGWLAASERADEYLSRIAECYEKAGESARAANFLRRAGRQSLDRSAPREALQFFERALSLLPVASSSSEAASASAGDVYLGERVELLLSLVETKCMLGQLTSAQADLKSALSLAWQLQDNRLVARTLYELSRVADLQGDYSRVRAYLEEALPLARRLVDASAEPGSQAADKAILAQVLNGLGSIEWRSGNSEAAISPLQECLALARALDDRSLELIALNTLGSVISDFGRYDEARSNYEQAREIAVQLGNRDRIVVMLNNLGELDRKEEKYPQAAERYREALALSREIGNQYTEALLLFNLGMTTLASGEVSQAKESFVGSLRLALEMGAQTLVLTAIIGLAWLRLKAGDHNTALAWLGLALQHPAADADLHNDANLVLNELRQNFSQEIIAAGLARGQEIKFDQLVQRLAAEGLED